MPSSVWTKEIGIRRLSGSPDYFSPNSTSKADFTRYRARIAAIYNSKCNRNKVSTHKITFCETQNFFVGTVIGLLTTFYPTLWYDVAPTMKRSIPDYSRSFCLFNVHSRMTIHIADAGDEYTINTFCNLKFASPLAQSMEKSSFNSKRN